MRALIETIRTTTPEGFDFEWLGDLVRSIDPAELDLTGCIPSIEGMTDNYARNILLLDPFEVVVCVASGVESAIHRTRALGVCPVHRGEVENVDTPTMPNARSSARGRIARPCRRCCPNPTARSTNCQPESDKPQ